MLRNNPGRATLGIWAGALLAALALGAGCASKGGGTSLSVGGQGTGGSTSGGSTSGGGATGGGTGNITALVTTPEKPLEGVAILRYELADPESDRASAAIDYSPDGGTTWRPATADPTAAGHESPSGLATSPLGARHAFAWNTRADLGSVNDIHVKVRVTPSDGAAGAPAETGEFAVVNLGRLDPDCDFENGRGVLVLSADMSGGFVPYSYIVNHVVHTKIYGDGKVVYREQADGDQVIYQGRIGEGEIVALFKLLGEKGFWSMQASYRAQNAPTDMPSARVTAKLRSGSEKSVSSYAGALSAPPGYMDFYQALHVPQIEPGQVVHYVRATISQYELTNLSYGGEEYQKKLDTPLDWAWEETGGPNGSPIWRKR